MFEYPFESFNDGHYIGKIDAASIGNLIVDKKGKVIYKNYNLIKLENPCTLMAETKALCDGMKLIPIYCNTNFSIKYGNERRDVTVNSDNKDLIDLMKNGGNIEILTKRRNGIRKQQRRVIELSDLKNLIESVQGIKKSYKIKFEKINGRGNNPAHFLCRKAERELKLA